MLLFAVMLHQMAGVPQPDGHYDGRTVAPKEGASVTRLISGHADRVHGPDYAMGWELFGRRAMRVGDWKVVWIAAPYGQSRWTLFNLADDPVEAVDLAGAEPEKLAELVSAWEQYARDQGVVLPATDTGYGQEDPWQTE